MKIPIILPAIITPLIFFVSCASKTFDDHIIFTNATIWDGYSLTMHPNSALLTYEGRIVEIIDMNDPDFPPGAVTIDLGNRFVVPGLINAHGHVGMAKGLQTGAAAHTEENVKHQLALYARYGITTVVSLGDEPEVAFDVRDNTDFASEGLARLFMSGPVLNPATPGEAETDVADLMQFNPDWVKIRVDDGLGTREKMSTEVYAALIEAAHSYGVPVAAHIVTLEDAKGIVEYNGDLIAHSVRDIPVDREFTDMMLDNDICITPTLTREVSVYIYSERPAFFDDPFFLAGADPELLEQLVAPDVQQRYTGRAAEYFREALPLAKANMMAMHNAGIRVALGTDSGPPARFQGYFEHMEMEMMQNAGMNPIEILTSATRYAAECMNLDDNIGTLEPGKWADFVVVNENPFDDIQNLRNIHGVYIGANAVQDVVAQ
jgi:imidazolonepropionase-like amidohydrolase